MRHLHYGADEWLAYKSRTISTDKAAEMETHLYICESCQEIYLDLIDQPDLDQAQQFIPPNFTEKLIGSLNIRSSEDMIKFPLKKPALNRKCIFVYYVTAAVITLALMSGGVFDSMVDQSMRFSHLCMLQSQSIEAKVSMDLRWQLFEDDSQWSHSRFNQERNVKDAK